MKTVLILSFFFPPMTNIGGIRLYGLAKNISIYGWKPIIITIKSTEATNFPFQVIQTDFDDICEIWKKRLFLNPKKDLNSQFNNSPLINKLTLIDYITYYPKQIICFPDSKIGWYNYALSAGEEIIKTEKIDVILSSSYPIISHLVAKEIAQKYNIPWIADFRDLWTNNHYTSNFGLIQKISKKLELSTIEKTSAITTVSEPLCKELKNLHRNKDIFSIPNGFDPELINHVTVVSNKFRVIYTGSLYEGKRDPTQLFTALDYLVKNHLVIPSDFKIDFYGDYEDWLFKEIEKYDFKDRITIHGPISHQMAIIEQRKSQILLLLTWNNPKEKGVYTGKLFEYLAAKRPILSIGYSGGGVIRELLNKTHAGIHITQDNELILYLIQAYHEFKESGVVQYHGVEKEILKYSHIEMTRKFAEIFNNICQQSGSEIS